MAQYRDPFTEKTKKPKKIKKKNNRGLLYSKNILKKRKDNFINSRKQNGIIGIEDDPFPINTKTRYKPSGVDEDTYTSRHRKLVLRNRFDREFLKKESVKSRKKYMKRKIK